MKKEIRSLGLTLVGLLLVAGLAACGAPPDATGTWEGDIDFEQGGEVAAAQLDLTLEQSEDGLVTGNGTITVRTPGEAESLTFESLRGRIGDDGAIRLEAFDESLLSEKSLELEGEVRGDRIEGSGSLSSAELLAEPIEVSGEYELQRQ